MGDQVVVLDDFDLLDPASRGVAEYLLKRVAQFGRVYRRGLVGQRRRTDGKQRCDGRHRPVDDR